MCRPTPALCTALKRCIPCLNAESAPPGTTPVALHVCACVRVRVRGLVLQGYMARSMRIFICASLNPEGCTPVPHFEERCAGFPERTLPTVSIYSLPPQDPSRPLVVDIGCGPGRCLLLLAQQAQHAEQGVQQAQQAHSGGHQHQQGQPGMVTPLALHTQLGLLGGDPSRVGAHSGTAGLHGRDAGALQGVGQGANFLGLDVGAGLLDQANSWAAERGLSHRLQYVAADALLVMHQLKAYPGHVRAVAVQVS